MRKFLLKKLGVLMLLCMMATTSSYAAGKVLLSEIEPYATTGYYWAFENKQSSLMGGSYSMTMMGEKYPNGFKFGEPGTAMFNLGKKYGKISGVVGLDDFENKKDTAVSFYADNQLVEYIDLKAFTAPIPFEIDVTGVTQLRIVKEKGYSEVDFAELMIEKAAVTSDRSVESSTEDGVYMVSEMDPYSTTGYYWAFGKASSSALGGDKSMTMGGSRYFYGFKFGAPGTATYNLQGEYGTLSGKIGLDDFENKKDTGVQFIGDGILLKSIDLPAYTLPQDFSVDVTGIDKLEIVKTPGYSEVDLAELKLFESKSEGVGSKSGQEVDHDESVKSNENQQNTNENQQNTNVVKTYEEPAYNTSYEVTKIKSTGVEKGPNYTVLPDYAQSGYDDVYFLNGKYVTAGTHGLIKTSLDGQTWTTLSTGQFDTVTGLAYGQDAYIATTDTGKILKSVDLKTWTTLPTGELTKRFYAVAYFENAFFALAENGVIFKSTDAQTFLKTTQIENAGPLAVTIFRKIEAVGDKLFVLSQGYAFVSDNGSDWSKLNLKATVTENGQSRIVDMFNFYDIEKGDSHYLITGNEDYFTSTDCITWTAHRISGYSAVAHKQILAASYLNGQFQLYVDEWLPGSVDERYIVRTDENGLRIEPGNSGIRTDLEGNKVVGTATGPTGIVAVGSDIIHSADGNSYQSQMEMPSTSAYMSEVNGYYFLSKRMRLTVFNKNGFVRDIETPFTGSMERMHDVAYGNGVYVAVGDKQVIMTSSDLLTFNETLTDNQKLPDMNMRPTISRVLFYGGRFVAMDYNGQVYTSEDGMSWTIEKIKSGYNSMKLKGVVNGKLTAVGFYEKRTETGAYAGDYGLILTSTDGKNWTEYTLRGTDWVSDIAFKDGKYLVTGQAGTFALSKDLKNWAVYQFDPMSEIMTQLGAYANIQHFSGVYVYNDVFYMTGSSSDGIHPDGNSNTVYQVGDSLSVYRPGDNTRDGGKTNSGFVLSSTDGLNWSWVMTEMRLPVTDLDQVSGKLVMTLDDGQLILIDHKSLQ